MFANTFLKYNLCLLSLYICNCLINAGILINLGLYCKIGANCVDWRLSVIQFWFCPWEMEFMSSKIAVISLISNSKLSTINIEIYFQVLETKLQTYLSTSHFWQYKSHLFWFSVPGWASALWLPVVIQCNNKKMKCGGVYDTNYFLAIFASITILLI